MLSPAAARAHGVRGYLRQLSLLQFVLRADGSLFQVFQIPDGSDQVEHQATPRVARAGFWLCLGWS